jgi:hypothetical protein
MPCLRAFCAARALPSGDLGPRDFAPFLRLASARALLTETAAADAAPTLAMAGFLRTGVGCWRVGLLEGNRTRTGSPVAIV